MAFNRRAFFTRALAALVAGSTMKITGSALADPVVGRYAMTIQLQQNLLAKHQALKGLPMREISEKVTPDADYLFHFLMREFPVSQDETRLRECTRLFYGELNINTLSMESLQSVLADVIPAIIIRRFLATERLPVDTQRMPSFDLFVSAYREMILPA